MKMPIFLKRASWWMRSRGVLFLSVFLLFMGALLVGFIVLKWFSQYQSFASLPLWLAVASTFFAAISSVASWIQAVEIQRQRESVERPYVIAYFDGSSRGTLYFVIENRGNASALDVKVTFDDPAPVDFAGRSLNTISLFQKPISFLPPGKMYRQVVDVGHRLLADDRPTEYKAEVSYTSEFGRPFIEMFEYNLAYLKQATVPPKTTEENLEDIAARLKEIKDILNGARGINSFLVETPEQMEERIARIDPK